MPYCAFPGIYFHTHAEHPDSASTFLTGRGLKGPKISLSRFRILILERKPFLGDLYFYLLIQPWLNESEGEGKEKVAGNGYLISQPQFAKVEFIFGLPEVLRERKKKKRRKRKAQN